MNVLSTQWSTEGSTSSEPMGLCITPIVKTLADNHTLDDRNHQGHHTTLLLSETLLSTAQASLCFGKVRSCDNQHRAICPGAWQVLDSTCRRRGVVRVLQCLQHGVTPTPETNHWHGYSSLSLTDWSAAGVTRSGRRIHRTWTPQIFICGNTLRTGCMATTPRLSLTWRQQSQQRYEQSQGRNAGGSSRTLPAASKCVLQRRGAHLEHIFWAPVKQRVFVVQTWNFGDVCTTGLTWCSWSFVSI